jgi:hypothetical protein
MSRRSQEESYRRRLEQIRAELGEACYARVKDEAETLLRALTPAAKATLRERRDPPFQLISSSEEPGSLDDARWFEEHPDRSHRLRVATPGEFDGLGSEKCLPEGAIELCLVRQIEPGRRLRCSVGVMADAPPADAEADDAFLAVLFDENMEASLENRPLDNERVWARYCMLVGADGGHRA